MMAQIFGACTAEMEAAELHAATNRHSTSRRLSLEKGFRPIRTREVQRTINLKLRAEAVRDW
jgi:hypothetical protein